MNRFQEKASHAAQVLGVLMMFVMIFPRAIQNIAMGLALIAHLSSGNYGSKWADVKSNPAAIISFLLLGVFVMGITYTPVSLSDSLGELKSYQELLIFPIAISLFTSEVWRRRAYFAFIWSIGLGVAISFAMYAGWLPAYYPDYNPNQVEYIPYTSRIPFGFFLAFATYLMIHHAVSAKTQKRRIVWSIFSVLSLIDLLFLVPGRTGHVVLIALLALLLIQYRHWLKRSWIIILLVISVVGAAAIMISPAFNSRAGDIELAASNPEASSIGQRLIYWQAGLRIIADYPLLGAGTGSFAHEFLSHAGEYAHLKAENPHNEYLLIAGQIGLLGLAVFIALFYTLFRCANQLPTTYKFALQGLVIAMAVGCLFNSFLRDYGEGHFFVIFAALFLSSAQDKEADA